MRNLLKLIQKYSPNQVGFIVILDFMGRCERYCLLLSIRTCMDLSTKKFAFECESEGYLLLDALKPNRNMGLSY